MIIINATEHDIVIYDEDGEQVLRTIVPSGLVLRCKQEVVPLKKVDNIPFVSITFGEIEGLPEEKENVVYIVSSIVKNAGLAIGRSDLVVPVNPVRKDGVIIGCRALG